MPNLFSSIRPHRCGVLSLWIHLEVSMAMGYLNSWMVLLGKSHWNSWIRAFPWAFGLRAAFWRPKGLKPRWKKINVHGEESHPTLGGIGKGGLYTFHRGISVSSGRGTPSDHPFRTMGCSVKNHPAIGVPLLLGHLHMRTKVTWVFWSILTTPPFVYVVVLYFDGHTDLIWRYMEVSWNKGTTKSSR